MVCVLVCTWWLPFLYLTIHLHILRVLLSFSCVASLLHERIVELAERTHTHTHTKGLIDVLRCARTTWPLRAGLSFCSFY